MTDSIVLIRLQVKPEHLASARQHTETLAAAARREPHCRSIRLLQNETQPAQLVLLETWADRSYYLSDAHQHSTHMLAYFEATKSMLADVAVETFSTVESPPDAVDEPN